MERHKQIEAFCQIGTALVRRDQTVEARAVLERAISAAETIEVWQYGRNEPGYSGAPVLAELARALLKVGEADRSAELVDRI